MNAQPEQILENNLTQQLVGLDYEKVLVMDTLNNFIRKICRFSKEKSIWVTYTKPRCSVNNQCGQSI